MSLIPKIITVDSVIITPASGNGSIYIICLSDFESGSAGKSVSWNMLGSAKSVLTSINS